MSEIKVGEYVRTKKGEICKVLGVRQEQRADKRVYSHLAYYLDNHKGSLTPAFIVKHSTNIIDLIEEGDLIKYDSNSYGIDIIEVVVETCKVDEDYDKGEGFVCTALDDYIRTKDIKSIVTKEQFKEMEYKVNEG